MCLGQAFYAGGSERSGQQIIGPAKPKNNDKNVTKIFESARKQGAMEADDDDDQDGHSSRAKKEKAFSGVGYSLGDDSTPSRTFGQPPAGGTAAASNRPEQVPLRFYSNGFTVGDGELRKFDENKEFMDHIKRGEVPPELRSLSAGGRQVEVINIIATYEANLLRDSVYRYVLKIIVAKNINHKCHNSSLSVVLVTC